MEVFVRRKLGSHKQEHCSLLGINLTLMKIFRIKVYQLFVIPVILFNIYSTVYELAEVARFVFRKGYI